MNSKDLIRELRSAGWVLDRIRGSHHVFKHPVLPEAVPIPHPEKDLPIGTLDTIRKQSGLK